MLLKCVRNWFGGRASSGPWPSSGRRRYRGAFSRKRSSGKGYPRGFEDVFAAVTGDGTKPPVLEPQETVEGAGGDEVGHLELPAEPFPRRFLFALRDAGHVVRVAD